ncbi:IS630 family transposase [Azospirillum agricola]|uniref:IS630 family transposase n=1 Tax=Azospirillum agricola TaxID=1720247 RepID=UPI0011787ADF|nr:IS630 family transposase [Azospirillum agricola]
MPALRIRSDLSSDELRRLARGESDGRVCRRLLAIAMALNGTSREAAARQAGMDRQTLRDWVVRYNAEGVEGLGDRTRTGRPPLLADALEAELAALIAAGPDSERDGIVEYRVRHIRELALRHFGADYSRSGMQDRLYRMRLSFLTPRPIHPKTDAAAQEAFKKNFADRLAAIGKEHPEAGAVEVWFQDEARIGQKGTLTRRWASRGSRPRAVRDHRFKSAYLLGAVCPARHTGAAIVMTRANTQAMTLMLEEISRTVAPGAHAAVVIDGAGWHTSGDLVVPANITLVPLPPYSPELNAIERLWQFMRDNLLAHRLFADLNAILDVCCQVWNQILAEPGRIRSTCGYH